MNDHFQKLRDIVASYAHTPQPSFPLPQGVSPEECAENVKQVMYDDNGNAKLASREAEGVWEIDLYGPFDSWFGITAESFVAAMPDDDDIPVQVNIKSIGGNLFESLAIAGQMWDAKRKFTARVDGLCASAAVNVLLACDERRAAPMSRILVHEPRAAVFGTADDMTSMADMLNDMSDDMAKHYASRVDMDVDAVRALMNEDKIISASKAVEYGILDGVIEAGGDKKKKGMKEMKASQSLVREVVAMEVERLQSNFDMIGLDLNVSQAEKEAATNE